MLMHLAQINIAELLYDRDGAEMSDFNGALDNINALAERQPGFVWRLKDDEDGNATGIVMPGFENQIINMSVWQDLASLRRFVFETAHAQVMARKAKWFPDMKSAHMALWWVEERHIPTLEEAFDKLKSIDEQGPTASAFTFDTPYGAAGTPMRLADQTAS